MALTVYRYFSKFVPFQTSILNKFLTISLLFQVHVLPLFHRLSWHYSTESQAGELSLESFCWARRRSSSPSVPNAPPRRSRRVHSLPNGPWATPNFAVNQKSGMASALPRPTADDDPTAPTFDVCQRNRVCANHSNELLLHVQYAMDATVLLVMRTRATTAEVTETVGQSDFARAPYEI